MSNKNNSNINIYLLKMENKKNNDNALVNKFIIDIRNLKKFDSETINNISNMSSEDIIQILNAYNDVMDAFCKFVEYLK